MDTGRPFAGFRVLRTHLGTSYHVVPVGGHPWTRAICGAGPGLRSSGWVAAGIEVTCHRCQQRLDQKALAKDVAVVSDRATAI
jgi:hypothetical protein